eukprot:COSAG05_NODE_38_length_27626_cov_78.614306_23_plen_69_part_00
MTTKLNLRLYNAVGVVPHSPSRVEHLALRAHRCISAAAAGDGSGLLPARRLCASPALGCYFYFGAYGI